MDSNINPTAAPPGLPLLGSRSADFQSAVSQGFQPAERANNGGHKNIRCPADWKSAIQQIGNLRYSPCAVHGPPVRSQIRDSGFGLLSGFGIRVSDFHSGLALSFFLLLSPVCQA